MKAPIASSVYVYFCVAAVLAQGFQAPLFAEQFHGDAGDGKTYEFQWPIKKVAVIGAGVGGMVAYREFKEAGFDVRVFERDDLPGGNWHYTEETAGPPPIPDADPSVGDYEPSVPARIPFNETYDDLSEEKATERLSAHIRPRPLFNSLRTTCSSSIQQIPEFPWPAGTPLQLDRKYVQRYLRSFASWHGLNAGDDNPDVMYSTRVETVVKRYVNREHRGWTLTLKRMTRTGLMSTKAEWWNEDFDAVLTATGIFNAPHVPDISGLEAWADKFPKSVTHANQYRRPEPLTNKTVLIVGGFISAVEIARDLNIHAAKVYESIRSPITPSGPGSLSGLPSNTTIIPEIIAFGSVEGLYRMAQGEVHLRNGTIIKGIDHIIFATGYKYSFPFLGQYHNSSLGPDDRAAPGQPQPLVTDGSHIRSLFMDFLYIEEPTLGFSNVQQNIDTFYHSRFTAAALAKVWLGHAKIPDQAALWEMHNKRVEESGGYKKNFNFQAGWDLRMNRLRYFVAWLNDAAFKHGGKFLDPPRDNLEQLRMWNNYRFPATSWNVSTDGDDIMLFGAW